MILVDANILIYAYDTASDRHEGALRWLEATLAGTEKVGLAWTVLLAFLRLVTSSRVFREPMSTKDAVAAVSDWLARPNVSIVEPGERHWQTLTSLLSIAQIKGPDVTDAHLAALAIDHGATLCTIDRDFARFPGLKTLDPVAG